MEPDDFEKKGKLKLKKEIKEISKNLREILDNKDASNLDEESKKELTDLLQRITHDAIPLIPCKDLEILNNELTEQYSENTAGNMDDQNVKKSLFKSFIEGIRRSENLERLASILIQIKKARWIPTKLVPFLKRFTRVAGPAVAILELALLVSTILGNNENSEGGDPNGANL